MDQLAEMIVFSLWRPGNMWGASPRGIHDHRDMKCVTRQGHHNKQLTFTHLFHSLATTYFFFVGKFTDKCFIIYNQSYHTQF